MSKDGFTTSRASYGETYGKLFGLQSTPTLESRKLRNSLVAFTRISCPQPSDDYIIFPVSDGCMLTYKISPLPSADIWIDGRHFVKETPKHYFELRDHRIPVAASNYRNIDVVTLYWDNRTLSDLLAEDDVRSHPTRFDFRLCYSDIIVKNLVDSVLPAFEIPAQASRLFVEHVGMALLSHVSSRYGGVARTREAARGGLTPWQLRRAKEMLSGNLSAEVSIEDLARDCGLSRSHFARAFKASVGQPPHRWLIAQRIDRAEDLLTNSRLQIGEIATICGFADQSHLTRVFIAARGVPPGEWRRRRLS